VKEEGCDSGSVWLGFFVGGIVGAGVALLFAQRETREKIKELAIEVKQKATGYVKQTEDRVSDVVSTGKELYEKNKSCVKSAIEAGKEAYEKEKDRLSKQST